MSKEKFLNPAQIKCLNSHLPITLDDKQLQRWADEQDDREYQQNLLSELKNDVIRLFQIGIRVGSVHKAVDRAFEIFEKGRI